MPLDSSVTLRVHTGKKVVEFDTWVIDVFPEKLSGKTYGVGVELVRFNDRIVNLGNYPIEAYFTNVDDNRNYVYSLQGTGMSKDRKRLVLFSMADAKAINHRESYRVPCLYKVVMQIGTNKHTVNGKAHDISFSGVSFVYLTENVRDINVDYPVSASVYDKNGIMHKMSGYIARVVNDYKIKGQTLIGVKFDEVSQDVMNLVAKLQRDELRLKKHQRSITG